MTLLDAMLGFSIFMTGFAIGIAVKIYEYERMIKTMEGKP